MEVEGENHMGSLASHGGEDGEGATGVLGRDLHNTLGRLPQV